MLRKFNTISYLIKNMWFYRFSWSCYNFSFFAYDERFTLVNPLNILYHVPELTLIYCYSYCSQWTSDTLNWHWLNMIYRPHRMSRRISSRKYKVIAPVRILHSKFPFFKAYTVAAKSKIIKNTSFNVSTCWNNRIRSMAKHIYVWYKSAWNHIVP